MLRSFIFTRKSFLVLLLTGLLNACATTSDELDLLQKSFMLYEHALRWQDYDLIIGFHKDEADKLSETRRQYLKQFRVTSYNVVFSKVEPDERHASQTVEIKYYNDSYNIERELTFNLDWEYDEKRKLWLVTSPMPDFK